MARRKETIWQNDFSFGAARPEAEERDDTPAVLNGLKEAQNTIVLTTGQTEERPGTLYEAETAATEGVEVDLGIGRVFDLHLTPTGCVLYASDGSVAYTNSSTTWITVTGVFGSPTFADLDFWVVPDPDTDQILIGSNHTPIYSLSIASGSWALSAFAFDTDLNGAKLQPYWPYYPGVTIQPSARTGSITITASASIFTAAHVGMSIRYVDREIVLTGFTSATEMDGTVVEELPKTYAITVADVSGFVIGQAVEEETLGGQGIITGIAASVLTVLSTAKYEEFEASNNLVGPNSSASISSLTTASPAASFLWDVQMLNSVHGYPGSATRHLSRVVLGRFPGARLGFAVSVAGAVGDFTMGANDADGFVETVGADLGGELLHVISAEDLLFMTTRGIYYHLTRDGSGITPTNIRLVLFSRVGSASVRPIAIDDGAVFVDAVGSQIFAATLVGDINKAWRARSMTKYHSHLVSGPTKIGATASGSQTPENFVYVVNSDGTAAVAQWDRDESRLSWRPWVTDGSFISIYQAFGKTYCIANRTVNSVAKTFRERFENGIYVDCGACVQISNAFPEG